MDLDNDDRGEIITKRLAAHGLADTWTELDALELSVCGYQDAGPGTAMASMALRCGWDRVQAALDASDLATVMSLRGVPHVHRRRGIDVVRAAMSTDNRNDLEAVCGPLPDAVLRIGDPVGEVARAMVEIFDELSPDAAVSKAELSTRITPSLPQVLVPFCERCATQHAIDGLFRLATLRARLGLVPLARTQTFRHLDSTPATRPDPTATAAARATLAGAARSAAVRVDLDQLAAWLGWHRRSLTAALEGVPDVSTPAAAPPDLPAEPGCCRLGTLGCGEPTETGCSARTPHADRRCSSRSAHPESSWWRGRSPAPGANARHEPRLRSRSHPGALLRLTNVTSSTATQPSWPNHED